METIKLNPEYYAIDPSKGRKYESIAYMLALVYKALQTRVECYLRPYDLSTAHFNLLLLAAYLNDGKGISQVEISKHLIVSASNITKLVEKSVHMSWLTRKTNPRNRRENIICITKKGQMLIDKIWPEYDRLVRGLTEKIPVKDRFPIERILRNWFIQLQEGK
ncbi:MAG: hypothetical protein IKP96_04550 [Elusimicrobiaceae bacterium]|nr:hypothetical protein [Elusimicrobiaceae bacterium]